MDKVIFSSRRGQAQLHNNPLLDHFQSWCGQRQLNYFGTCDDIDICQCVATPHNREKGKTKKLCGNSPGAKVSRFPTSSSADILSSTTMISSSLWSKIYHKNEFTAQTDLSKFSKYDSLVSCSDTTASPGGGFATNTARLNVSEVPQEPCLVDTLVNVWSKMARFAAKRQTSDLPWKQTASQTSR